MWQAVRMHWTWRRMSLACATLAGTTLVIAAPYPILAGKLTSKQLPFAKSQPTNTFLDLDLLVNRGIGWVGWKYQSGWVEWEFDWNAFAAWYEAENFKDSPERIYNGSGQLIYRGAVMDYKQPIPSIRLKAQRRGLQDYEYFWLLAQKTGSKKAPDDIVNRIVYKRPFGKVALLDTEIWKNNPEEWDKARIAIGERLAK